MSIPKTPIQEAVMESRRLMEAENLPGTSQDQVTADGKCSSYSHNSERRDDDSRLPRTTNRVASVRINPDHYSSYLEQETQELKVVARNWRARKDDQKVYEEREIQEAINYARKHLRGKRIEKLQRAPYTYSGNHELVPKELRDIVIAIAQETGWPEFGVLLVLLGSVAMAMRGRYVVQADSLWKEPVILYQLIIAASGNKKSLLAGLVKAPFVEFIKEKQRAYTEKFGAASGSSQDVDALVGPLTKAAARSAIKKGYDKNSATYDIDAIFNDFLSSSSRIKDKIESFETKKSFFPTLFFEDISYRGLLNHLQNQGCVASYFAEEGNSFINIINTRGANLDIFLKGYAMDDFISQTKAHGIVNIYRTTINFLLIIQDIIAVQMYKSERLASTGATPRFLPWFYQPEEDRVYLYNPRIDTALPAYKDKIRLMLERNYTQDSDREIFYIPIENGAYDEIKRYQRQNEKDIKSGRYAYMKPFMSKLHGTAVRIAGVLHAWKHEFPEQHPITREEIQFGIKIADAYIPHAEFAFREDGVKALNDAQKIINWIKRHSKDTFTARDIAQGVSGMKNDNINPALDLLEQHNVLAQIIFPGHSRICVLHPDFDYRSNM